MYFLFVCTNSVRRQCPYLADLTTALVFDVMGAAALLDHAGQMNSSLAVMIVKGHISECHLYHTDPPRCQRLK